jgi:4-amino-4-deoxy-L-arabinose transferase-like glycosyltransferase
LLGLILLFVVCLLPYAGSFFYHHVDERFYTNAAITMLQGGDPFTPRWLDGSLALRKPIVTYWVTAAAYRLFGIGQVASRIPAMLAGVLVIVLTYRATLALTRSRDRAVLAALITLSQYQLVIASMRANPDVYLCLFMLVSGWGFLTLIVRAGPRPAAYWAAYGGAGLAVATKGLLAVVFVAFAWFFARLYRIEDRPGAWRRLVHAPSMIVGTLVAGWWFAVTSWMHGSALWHTFLTDQIFLYAEAHGKPFSRIPVYIVLLLVNLLPWILILLELAVRDRRNLLALDPRERALFHFVALWSVIVAVICGFSDREDGRYLLPAGPLGAIVLAGVIERAEPVARRRALSHLLALSLAALAGLGVVLGLVRMRAGPPMAGIGILALFAAVIAAVALATWRWRLVMPATAVGVAALVGFPLSSLGVGSLFSPDAGVREAVEALARRDDPSQPVLFAGMGENTASRVRLASGGSVHIVWTPEEPDSAEAARFDAVVVPVVGAARLDLSTYRTREVTLGIGSITGRRLARVILGDHATEVLDRLQERYVVAIRR